ncbi:MAG: hypothetical protein FWF88_02400 [Peptococcaceae bacterium]|nr:hypothetical protein [Peptococcaceae bacterium]
MSARTGEYADDYFSQCVAVLERTGADNVGGVGKPGARDGFWGNAIAQPTKFGVGKCISESVPRIQIG